MSAAAHIWTQIAVLAAQADAATIDVVIDHTRPNTYAVMIGGAAGTLAMRGARHRCDHYADTLRRDPELVAQVLRQARGWRRGQ